MRQVCKESVAQKNTAKRGEEMVVMAWFYAG
jgi:hypothetical protein